MKNIAIISLIFICLGLLAYPNNTANAGQTGQNCSNRCDDGAACPPEFELCAPIETDVESCGIGCGCVCFTTIHANHMLIRDFMSELFNLHRNWMIRTYFMDNILYAMAAMANQMTSLAMQQLTTIGKFFDAKHQLETQRLFETLMAEAHKDYQPSEGLCDIGTTIRGLVASDKIANLSHQVLSKRGMDRQLKTGNNLSQFSNSDLYSRIDNFKKMYCSTADNANGLKNLCEGVNAPRQKRNADVDYTRSVETKLTIEEEFFDGQNPHSDEIATHALMANLIGHKPLPQVGSNLLADGNGYPRMGAYKYMDLRSVAAKRSVAQNSISAIMAERASGARDIEYAPYVKSVLLELGLPSIEIEFILGARPSYFSQMEVLTKKLYQNPVFYTELYDKPANVLRKRAAIRAINLIQDRDFYNSLLRSEAVMSVLLETMLQEEHDRVFSHLNRLRTKGDPVNE